MYIYIYVLREMIVIYIYIREYLARKERKALPPYCKGVSKKQAFKDSCSFFVLSFIVETVEHLNVCTI